MKAFTLFRLELIRRLRDPLSLIIWLAIPFALTSLLFFVFGRGGERVPRARMLIVDHDGTFVSRFVTQAFGNEKVQEFLLAEVVSEEEARKEMDRGKASALLEIPQGFQERYLGGESIELAFHRNPAESILPDIAREVCLFLAEGATQVRAILLPSVDEAFPEGILAGDPSLEQVQALSERIYRIMENPQARNLMTLEGGVGVDAEEQGRKGPRMNIVQLFAPGFLVMSLIFMASGMTQEVQEDFGAGTFRRGLATGTSVGMMAAVKAAAVFLVMCLNGMVLLVLFSLLLGFNPGNVLYAAGLLAAGSFSLLVFALFLRSLTRSPEAGNAASTAVMVGLAFLGGCFMPLAMLPGTFSRIADFLNTGWAVKGFILNSSGDAAGAVGLRILFLMVLGLLLLFPTGVLIRRRVERP